VTAGDALLVAIRRIVMCGVHPSRGPDAADAIFALPELRALIAERDELRATVERVRELASWRGGLTVDQFRRALEATSRPRSDAQGVTGVSGSTRDDETVGDE
jgi:hypothetical protein